MNPFRQSIANLGKSGISQGQGFNSYAAGDKRYGLSARRGPNTGMTLNKQGYADRDRRAAIRKNLLLRRLQANQAGRPLSADATRQIEGLTNYGR